MRVQAAAVRCSYHIYTSTRGHALEHIASYIGSKLSSIPHNLNCIQSKTPAVVKYSIMCNDFPWTISEQLSVVEVISVEEERVVHSVIRSPLITVASIRTQKHITSLSDFIK